MEKLTQFLKSLGNKQPKNKRWQDDLPPLPKKPVIGYETPVNFNEFANNLYKQLR
jgi:hypothetical protein